MTTGNKSYVSCKATDVLINTLPVNGGTETPYRPYDSSERNWWGNGR